MSLNSRTVQRYLDDLSDAGTFLLKDSGSGVEIAQWSAAAPQPTAPQLATIQATLDAEDNEADLEKQLSATDKDMARIAEDIIGLLVAGNVIDTSNLPQEAQDKLAARAALRASLS